MPIKVLDFQLEALAEVDMLELMGLESDFLVVLANIEIDGMYLDTEKWMENYEIYLEKAKSVENELLEIADIN